MCAVVLRDAFLKRIYSCFTCEWSLWQKRLLLLKSLLLVIAMRRNTAVSELTVLKGVHEPLQVGARRLGACADGHSLAVKVVGWRAGLEDVGSHVLWGKREGSLNITWAPTLLVPLLENDMWHWQKEINTHVIASNKKSNTVGPPSIPLCWDLSF